MVVEVTPPLRASLVRAWEANSGSPFATSVLWERAGFPARSNWMGFENPTRPRRRTAAGRIYKALREVLDESLGFDPITEHRLKGLAAEESIFLFDQANRAPQDATAKAARSRARTAQRAAALRARQ